MDKSFIEKMLEVARPEIVHLDGYNYSTRQLHLVYSPQAETLKCRTLSGFVSLVKSECGAFTQPIIIQVTDHMTVTAYSAINGGDRSREILAQANAEVSQIAFGRFVDYESMIISLQSQYLRDTNAEKLLSFLGGVCVDESVETTDNGISQAVTAKKGIALKEKANVPSIVELAPYRTFVEIEQPTSKFLLRLKDGPVVALFEADGGAWKNTARATIANYLRDAFKDVLSDAVIVTD